MDLDFTLIIAGLSALVGLLCLGLFVVALIRIGKAKKAGGTLKGESSADLRQFARNQLLSAIVMFVLAIIIFLNS